MSWLTVVILAYLILAVVNVADKFLLEKVIPSAKTYAFLVGSANLLLFIIAPWFLAWPGWSMLLVNILVGASFSYGAYFLYKALRDSEASRIFTLVGGIVPILVAVFSFLLLGERFSINHLIAIIFLATGTVVISATQAEHSIWFKVKEWLHMRSDARTQNILIALLSALFFALFWVGTKHAFNNQDFLSALIWIRLGAFLAVSLFLVKSVSRSEIFSELKESNSKKNNKFIFLGASVLAAAGGILQNYAVSLGSVALVASLQGLQYALLLILTYFLTLYRPDIVHEGHSAKIIMKKIISILLIGIGLYFIVI